MDGSDETKSLWINGIGKKVIPKVLMHILYIKARVVSVCLSICGDKQGRAGRPGQTLAH